MSAKRATVHDLAKKAGVSLATIDRVLNHRPGVRPATRDKVEAAIEALRFRRDLSASLLARSHEIRLKFILPSGSNPFMGALQSAIDRYAAHMKAERVAIEKSIVRAFNPDALAEALDALASDTCHCAIIVAIDDDCVRDAVARAEDRGIGVVTLVSDLPESRRRHFVGIDNVAAGRTAAALLGRFCPAPGRIGLIAGALSLRDHRQRLEGFREEMAESYPHLQLAGPVEGFDDPHTTRNVAARLIASSPALVGLYSMGEGNAGLLAALRDAGPIGSRRVIAHELTPITREGLESGLIDVVLDQNAEGEIRAAIALARQVALREDAGSPAEPIEIGVFLRENLPRAASGGIPVRGEGTGKLPI